MFKLEKPHILSKGTYLLDGLPHIYCHLTNKLVGWDWDPLFSITIIGP